MECLVAPRVRTISSECCLRVEDASGSPVRLRGQLIFENLEKRITFFPHSSTPDISHSTRVALFKKYQVSFFLKKDDRRLASLRTQSSSLTFDHINHASPIGPFMFKDEQACTAFLQELAGLEAFQVRSLEDDLEINMLTSPSVQTRMNMEDYNKFFDDGRLISWKALRKASHLRGFSGESLLNLLNYRLIHLPYLGDAAQDPASRSGATERCLEIYQGLTSQMDSISPVQLQEDQELSGSARKVAKDVSRTLDVASIAALTLPGCPKSLSPLFLPFLRKLGDYYCYDTPIDVPTPSSPLSPSRVPAPAFLPDHTGELSLCRILLALSLYRRRVGYVQGINDIACMFMALVHEHRGCREVEDLMAYESEVFWLTYGFVTVQLKYFIHQPIILSSMDSTLEHNISRVAPPICRLLQRANVPLGALGLGWGILMLARQMLNPAERLRLWEAVLTHPSDGFLTWMITAVFVVEVLPAVETEAARRTGSKTGLGEAELESAFKDDTVLHMICSGVKDLKADELINVAILLRNQLGDQ
eukprot:gnl/Dysnectes_brevis/3217_a4020_828.p1 GENE.gnl/Dysnectes_brevis/3217_a4020_828~~gnl/Dysnectes_brevis/3217_a4020_828.p1  ORF type:complete len:533 (-),score=103.77 gnl/Dysnectes_brevis/3217_a4020_828:51-1649(-)